GDAVEVELRETLILLVLRADQNVQAGGVHHFGRRVHVTVTAHRAGARGVETPFPRNRQETRLGVRGEIGLQPVELRSLGAGAIRPADGVFRPGALASAFSRGVQDDDVPGAGVEAVVTLRRTDR